MHLQEGRPVQLQNRLQNLGYCLPHRFPQQDPQGILVHGAPPRAKVCPPIKHGPLHINPYTTLPEGWYAMDYPEFLEERRRLMAAVIREGFERLRGGHGTG
ncbi:hypothetical protein TthAA229_13970 [Thermus thermophilus]|nr:hypothetical protein TthAA220_14000 [Thermus thermophilus]BBL84916.1 hypothetical protein TthAA229_13970 [Thermus thermophilus]